MKQVYCPPTTLRTQVRLESAICVKSVIEDDNDQVEIEEQENGGSFDMSNEVWGNN